MRKFSVCLTFILLLVSTNLPLANAWDPQPTNPFPGVAFGAEVPGYTVEVACLPSGDCGIGIVPVVNCPPWTAADGRDGYTSGKAKRFCRNSWTPPTSAADDEDFRNRQKLAEAAATLESQNYNAAHPGEQKCVTWGPIVHANGISTASGGVCANPVGTKPDGTTVQVPSTQSGSSSTGSSSTGSSSTGSSSTGSSSTGSSSTGSSSTGSSSTDSGTSTTTTSSTASPQINLTQFGVGKPFTRVVPGRVSVSDCPAGFQSAINNIDGISSNGATECWPAEAWAAYSIGGTTWSKFKSTNISEAVQQATQTSIEINKIKAIALNRAQQDANLNIGKTMCVQWAYGQESGQECAFIPNQGSSTKSGSQTDTSTATSSASDTKTSTISASDTKTSAIAVQTSRDSVTAITNQIFVGTVTQVKQAVSAVVADTNTASTINTLLQKVSDLAERTLKRDTKLPINNGFEISARFVNSSVCRIKNSRIEIKKSGTCQLRYSVTDGDNNVFRIVTDIKVKKEIMSGR